MPKFLFNLINSAQGQLICRLGKRNLYIRSILLCQPKKAEKEESSELEIVATKYSPVISMQAILKRSQKKEEIDLLSPKYRQRPVKLPLKPADIRTDAQKIMDYNTESIKTTAEIIKNVNKSGGKLDLDVLMHEEKKLRRAPIRDSGSEVYEEPEHPFGHYRNFTHMMQELPFKVKSYWDPEFNKRNLIIGQFQRLRWDQRYIEERRTILGADLAAAHFIVARGGKVKFLHHDKWHGMDATPADVYLGNKFDKTGYNFLPNKFIPDLYIEAIDASGMPLMYESLKTLENLEHLKYLDVSCCFYVDDWTLQKFHQFSHSLEFLNVSGCPKITEKGLSTLHILPLQRLIMFDLPKVSYPELTAIMVQDMLPNCIVHSIDYSERTRLENFVDEPYEKYFLSGKTDTIASKKDNLSLISPQSQPEFFDHQETEKPKQLKGNLEKDTIDPKDVQRIWNELENSHSESN